MRGKIMHVASLDGCKIVKISKKEWEKFCRSIRSIGGDKMKISLDNWKRLRDNVSEENFRPIYEASKALVYTICIRILRTREDAADAFQSTYARLIALAGNPEESAKLSDVDDTIRILAVREASNLSKRRRRRAKKEFAMEEITHISDASKTPEGRFEEKEKMAIIQSLVNQLPERYRIPVILHYFQGMTHEEVSRALGKTRPAITMRLSKALKKLEPMIRKAGLGEATVLLGGLAGALHLADPPASLGCGFVFSKACEAANTLGVAGLGQPPAHSFMEAITRGMASHKSILIPASVVTIGLVIGGIGLAKKKSQQPPAMPEEKSMLNVRKKPLSEKNKLASPSQKKPKQETVSPVEKDAPSVKKETKSKTGRGKTSSGRKEIVPMTFHRDHPATGPLLIVSGKVTLEEGSPALDARLNLVHITWEKSVMLEEKVAETKADKNGEYRLQTEDHPSFLLTATRKGNASASAFLQDQEAARQGGRKQGARKITRNFILSPAAPVKGVVLDDHKKPIPGATVDSFFLDQRETQKTMVKTQAVTDQKGNFAILDMHTGEVTLNVNAKEYVPATKGITAPDENVQIILSSQGASLEGRVFSKSSGEAIPGVEVRAFLSPRPPDLRFISPIQTTTDKTGGFHLDHLVGGTYHINAEKEDLYLVPGVKPGAYNIPLAENEKKSGVNLFMYEGHTIRGIVVEEQSGEPLVGVRISLVYIQHPKSLSFTTGPDGTFELTGVPPNASGINAQKRGYAIHTKHTHQNHIPLDLKPDNLEITQNMEMLRKTTISGKVITQEGQPLPEAQVVLHSRNFISQRGKPENVDSSGMFSLEAKPFTTCRIKATAPGFPFAFSRQIHVQEEQVRNVEIILKPGVSLSGTVLNEQGEAIEGAEVKTSKYYQMDKYYHTEQISSAETDADGRFHFPHLPPVEIRLVAEKKGFSPSREHKIDLSVDTNQPELQITLRSSHFIAGIVTDDQDKPLANAQVFANRRYSKENSRGHAQTDAKGRFRIEGLINLPHRIHIHHPQYGQEFYESVKVDQEDLVLVMGSKAKVKLIGRVVDETTGDPVEEFSVSTSLDKEYIKKSPDTPGMFTAEKMHVGTTYRFTITSPFYTDMFEEIATPKDRDTIQKTFRMSAGGKITGRVIDKQNHRPLTGVRINITQVSPYPSPVMPGRTPLDTFITGSDGRFSFKNVSVGRNVMEFIPPSPYVKQSRHIEVKSGETSDFGDVEIGSGGTIEGRLIKMPEILPLAQKRITLSPPNRELRQTSTNANGEFQFQGVENGHSKVTAPDYNIYDDVWLEVNEKKQVELFVGTGILRGKVMKGASPCYADVSLENKIVIDVETNQKGEFEVKHLAPGEWKLDIEVNQPLAMRETFTIQPGEVKEKVFHLPIGSIEGTVLDKEKQPVKGAWVSIRRAQTDGTDKNWFLSRRGDVITDADGAFRIEYLCEDNYKLTATKDGLGKVTLEDVHVPENAAVNGVVLEY